MEFKITNEVILAKCKQESIKKYEKLKDKNDLYILNNNITFYPYSKIKTIKDLKIIKDFISREKFNIKNIRELPDLFNKPLGNTYKFIIYGVKDRIEDCPDRRYRSVVPDFYVITILLFYGVSIEGIYQLLCELNEKIAIEYQKGFDNIKNQIIPGWFGIRTEKLINILEQADEIMKDFKQRYNIPDLSFSKVDEDGLLICGINNSLKAQAEYQESLKNEPKVLTGVKDIKEFSEPVQKIIPIFKGENSDKIIKKEEIKIEVPKIEEQKTIIEENENETLINQIKVKQQELSQLIDKLCINLSS